MVRNIVVASVVLDSDVHQPDPQGIQEESMKTTQTFEAEKFRGRHPARSRNRRSISVA